MKSRLVRCSVRVPQTANVRCDISTNTNTGMVVTKVKAWACSAAKALAAEPTTPIEVTSQVCPWGVALAMVAAPTGPAAFREWGEGQATAPRVMRMARVEYSVQKLGPEWVVAPLEAPGVATMVPPRARAAVGGVDPGTA